VDREAELIAGVEVGDENAFAELYERYHQRLLSFFVRKTRDHDAAEELIQDTMMLVWAKAGQFNGTSRASTWIFGIGYRKLLEWNRAKNRQQAVFESGNREDGEPVQETTSRPEHAVEHAVGQDSLVSQVQSALGDLSDEHRDVVTMTFQEGMSYGEIADTLGIQPGTVKSRMYYAKRQLKHCLDQRGLKGDELWQIAKGL